MSGILGAIASAFSWLLPFLIGVAFAVPFWLFPSPIGRRKRERELETLAQKAAELALLKDRENREPGRLISLNERQRIADMARASVTSAIHLGGHMGISGDMEVIRGGKVIYPVVKDEGTRALLS